MSDVDWDEGYGFDGTGRLHEFTIVEEFPPPPDVIWTWTKLEQWALTSTVPGQQVALAMPRGVERYRHEYGYRTASEMWAEAGDSYVLVLAELDWRVWQEVPAAWRPLRPRGARAVSARNVWVYHQAPTRSFPREDPSS